MKTYDEKIIMSFAVYHRTVDLMKATGLSKATIVRYKKDDELMTLANKQRDELLKSAVHRMECELLKTIATLCQIRDNPRVNAQTRVSACNTILNHFQTLRFSLEIQERVEALEKRQSEDI